MDNGRLEWRLGGREHIIGSNCPGSLALVPGPGRLLYFVPEVN